MPGARAALAVALVIVVAAIALSGGSGSDPRTPPALPGLPPPFLGTAVIASGGTVAAIDSYGNVVDVRALGAGGGRLLSIPAERQVAGTVSPESAVLARMPVAAGSAPLWRADSVTQRYLPGTNVLRTVARLGGDSAAIVRGIGGQAAAGADRRWVARSRPLGRRAPGWARRMYERSLLVLRALTDLRGGGSIAGARDGWAYVWPRDAAAVAIALAAAGHRREARRVVRFLARLDLGAAARFTAAGDPVPGRAAQGDAAGWVAAAARAVGLAVPTPSLEAQDSTDYQEKEPGDLLANAIAAADGTKTDAMRRFQAHRRGVLVREAGNPDSGLDSAAAWAVRPFPRPELFPAARRTLLRLAADRGRYGITPSSDWPEEDPWTAPTAWSAWSLAALGERRAALALIGAIRRAATPLDLLPERVDARTGIPRSTTPLAWSHAFAILALLELW
jgi:glucoamylase